MHLYIKQLIFYQRDKRIFNNVGWFKNSSLISKHAGACSKKSNADIHKHLSVVRRIIADKLIYQLKNIRL